MQTFIKKLFRALRYVLPDFKTGAAGLGTTSSRADARSQLDSWRADAAEGAAERAQVAEKQARAAQRARVAEEHAREAERARVAEEHARAAQRKQEEKDRPVEAAILDLMARRSEMANRFLDLATRHVARKDEYGMERWRDLPKLIYGCITRLGEAEGFEVHLDAPRNYQAGSIRGIIAPERRDGGLILYYRSALYAKLFNRLEVSFRAHYSSLDGHDHGSGLDSMSGEDFEIQIASRFAKCGCQCEMTPATGDQGADLIVHYNGRKIAVQVKRRSGAVGNSAVQEVIASQRLYRCNEAWVVTNSRFTKSARDVAMVHGVVLVEGTELARLQSILDGDRSQANETLFG